LQKTYQELIYLNQTLEQMVHERMCELTVSEHKYRCIFEIIKDIIIVTRRDGIITDINPYEHALLTRKGTLTVGRSFAEFMVADH
jgi:PAS domain-containing protein